MANAEPSGTPRAFKILVADDERDTVVTLSELLHDEGYEVRPAFNGRDAIAAINEFDPDVAILDINMPGANGWDVARSVRKHQGGRDRPVLIALSGQYTKSADKLLAQTVGFRHYLTKPFEPRELIKLLTIITTSP